MSRLFLTGATGFLGSHVAATWLRASDTNTVAALVRADTADEADNRLKRSLTIAFHDQGEASPTAEQLSRVLTVRGDILHPSWAESAALRAWWGAEPEEIEILHSAAALSLAPENHAFVYEANVTGTRRLLSAIATLPSPAAFNHVSTAYVAGSRDGVIREEIVAPPEFNNPYESSKHACETMIRDVLGDCGTPWRIFRPSIIIGHSVTHRVSSEFGFYKVLTTFGQLGVGARVAIAPITLPFKRDATIDLIPVDIVVDEMLALIGAGPASFGKVFHLSNEYPLTVADIFFGIAPLAGLPIDHEQPKSARERSTLDVLATRAVRRYLPYFAQARVFDRTNVRSLGAGSRQAFYRLDLVRLRAFAETFYRGRRAAPEEALVASDAGEADVA